MKGTLSLMIQWLDMPMRLLFGRDVFISYSRKDAAPYAAALAQVLSETHSCYLDQHAAPRGNKLPRALRRDLRRAGALVVIVSNGARESFYVAAEIDAFAATGRPVLPIEISDTEDPQSNERWPHLVGVFRRHETAAAFSAAQPSRAVMSWLHASLTFTKQETRQRRASYSATALLIVSIGGAVWAQWRAMQANTQALDAEQRRKQATSDAIRAETIASQAKAQAEDARAAEADARKNALDQQLLAESRRLSGLATVQVVTQPDVGLLLAAHAYEKYPSSFALDTLFQGLTRHAGLMRIRRGGLRAPVVLMAASTDGTRVATLDTRGGVLVWNTESLEVLFTAIPPDLQHSGAISSSAHGLAALNSDGSLLAVADGPGVVLWDVNTKSRRAEIPVGSRTTFAFGGDHTLAIVGDRNIQIWDTSTPKRPTHRMDISLTEDVLSIVIDATGTYLGILTPVQVLACRIAECSEQRTPLLPEEDSFLSFLAISPDAERPWAAVLNLTGHVYLMDLRENTVQSFQMFRDLDFLLDPTNLDKGQPTLAYSADGRTLSASVSLREFVTADLFNVSSADFVYAKDVTRLDKSDTRDQKISAAIAGARGFLTPHPYPPGVLSIAPSNHASGFVLSHQFEPALALWNPDASVQRETGSRLVAQACEVAGRRLSKAERVRFGIADQTAPLCSTLRR